MFPPDDAVRFDPGPPPQLCLAGTGIDIVHVIRRHQAGQSAGSIAADAFAYPVPVALIEAALAYYDRNRLVLDAHLADGDAAGAADEAAYRAQEPTPAVRRIQTILAARRAAEGS